MFRSGTENIGPHSDDAQGEKDIVTVMVQCEHHHVVRFVPKQQNSKLNIIMNGKLQKYYRHTIEPTKEEVNDARLVMVVRSGNFKTIFHDSGQPMDTFEPMDEAWTYSLDNHPELMKGRLYRYM
jgi:hypothetical protein